MLLTTVIQVMVSYMYIFVLSSFFFSLGICETLRLGHIMFPREWSALYY